MLLYLELLFPLAVIALVFYWERMRFVAWYFDLPRTPSRVGVEKDVMIPMRDGVNLAGDIYRPKRQGRYPCIVVRTPYEKGEMKHEYPFLGKLFASQGYACLIQDTRGKHRSEGHFYAFAYEGNDAYDTVDWIAEQDWCDGNVGMFGSSYLGLSQWLSAPLQNPHLKAMVPTFVSQKAYDIVRGNSGVFRLKDALVWNYENMARQKRSSQDIDWKKAVFHLPVIQADEQLSCTIPAFKDWVQHSDEDGYWGQWRADDKIQHIITPALVVAGWFDMFLASSLFNFQKMISEGGSEEARQTQLIVGPWTHHPDLTFKEISYGKSSLIRKQLHVAVRWYDHWLKGLSSIDAEWPIHLFVMGANIWRREREWPLTRTLYKRYYLHSGGRAMTAQGDGKLTLVFPDVQTADTYTYDPLNPVPSIGGSAIFGDGWEGPQEQKEVEGRRDVLVYTTDPLEEDVEVTGPIALKLYASSSAPDTDFVGKLTDVHPNGKSYHVQVGIIRARYRLSLSEPSFLEKDRVYLFHIDMAATSQLFKKGHRIRLQITSSHFPEHGRNLNTKEDPNRSKVTQKAHQVIYHDKEHPSHLILPIIPATPKTS